MAGQNTGNPIGSIDLRDLHDNAKNLDFLINGDAEFYYDRFNVKRISLAGLTKRVDALALQVSINVKGYTALRAYVGTSTVIQVLPASTRTTGGIFILDKNDEISEDDGGTIIVSANGWRWKRVGFTKTVVLSWWEIPENNDSTAALLKAVKTPATELIIDLDIDVRKEINLTGTLIKKIAVLGGRTVKRIGNGSIFVKNGTLVGTPIILTNETTAPLDAWLRVTGNDVSTILINDWIYINSNCITPNVTSGSRTGMLRKVVGKSTNFLQLDMSLSQEIKDVGLNKGKIYLIEFGEKVLFEGGTYTSDSTVLNKTPLLHFVLCHTPDLNKVRLIEHGGSGASFMHCLGGAFNESETSFLTDDSSNGNFGYGIHLGGGTRDYSWNTGQVEHCRHGITTGTAVLHTQSPENSWLPWTAPWFSDLNIYGVPESIYMGPVACRDCTNAAIDTHENGVNITITPNISGGFDGINIRGWGVNVDGGQVIGTRRSNIRIFSAATNPVSNGWVGEIKIKGTLLKGMSLSGATEGGSIYTDQPGGVLYLEDVTIEESSAEALNVTSPDTVLKANNLTIVKSGSRGLAPAIRNAGKNSKITGLTIKNFATGIIDTGINNEYIDVNVENVPVLSTGNGRVTCILKSGQKGDAQPGRYLISGGRITANNTPAVDNLMYVIPITVPNACKMLNFVINVAAVGASSIVTRFALYNDNGKGYPGEYVCGGRSLTGLSLGINKIVPSDGTLVIQPGIYWVAIVQQGPSPYNGLTYTDEAVSGIFTVGLTTDIAALSGIACYTKIHSGGIGSGIFSGQVSESPIAPKIAIELQ